MADATQDAAPQPRRKLAALLPGLALAAAMGAGGYGAVHFGLLDSLPTLGRESGSQVAETVFVDLPPLHVSLGPVAGGRVMRFAAALEVAPAHKAEVERLMPRLLDVLNTYLRAVEPEEFGAPGALIRLRAQMLRRLQVVAGEGRVRDLLVTEFVVN